MTLELEVGRGKNKWKKRKSNSNEGESVWIIGERRNIDNTVEIVVHKDKITTISNQERWDLKWNN